MIIVEIIVVILIIGVVYYLSKKKKIKLQTKTKYEPTDAVMTDDETDLFDIINRYRNDYNLSQLKSDLTTKFFADEHTVDMVNLNKLSHDGFTNRFDDLMKIGGVTVGECVGYGYTSMNGFMNGYILSPTHKEQLDKPNYTHVGVSVMLNDEGKKYNTLLFVEF